MNKSYQVHSRILLAPLFAVLDGGYINILYIVHTCLIVACCLLLGEKMEKRDKEGKKSFLEVSPSF
jgi:hypothetical protein